MLKRIIIISLIIIVAVILLVVLYFLIFPEITPFIYTTTEIKGNNTNTQGETNTQVESTFKKISLQEIMDIIKTDKDYNDLSGFLKNFDPQLITYIKLGSNEYKTIKPEWQKKGLDGRIGLVDKINLTDFTYWVEIANKKDTSKGLLAVIDITEKKSLLLMALMSIEAGVGI